MNKLHREEAALALMDAGIKLLKGRAPVRHAFFTREPSVTLDITVQGWGRGMHGYLETINCHREKGF